MTPILLTPSGELPNGLTLELITSLGLTPVYPTAQPRPEPGFALEEGEPVLVKGKYQQRWKQVPIEQPPLPPLADLKAEALQRVDQLHAEALLHLTGNPTQAEQTTWAGKVALAEAIQAGGELTPSQRAFLTHSGIPAAGYPAYAQMVLAKSAAYWALVGLADKVRGDCKDRIVAAKTHEQLEGAAAANQMQHDQALAAVAAQRAA